jgi:dTDP-4-dehydrorhamnose 3,5-epimerase
MKYTKLNIPDIILIQPQVFGDHRGFFMETFRDDEFRENVADITFVQDNHSKSTQGVLTHLFEFQGKIVLKR